MQSSVLAGYYEFKLCTLNTQLGVFINCLSTSLFPVKNYLVLLHLREHLLLIAVASFDRCKLAVTDANNVRQSFASSYRCYTNFGVGSIFFLMWAMLSLDCQHFVC